MPIKKIALVATAATVVTGAAVGAAFGINALTGSNASSLAEVVPSDAVAFASVNLDPKASQKLKINDLLKRIESGGGSDAPFKASDFSSKGLMDELVDGCGDLGTSWAGDNFGVAVLPGKTNSAVLYVEQNDTGKAEKFVKAAAGAKGEGCNVGGASVEGDWVVIGEDAKSVKAASTDAAGFKSLDTNKEFTSDIESLDDEGILTYWVDTDSKALTEAAGEQSEGLKSINSVFGTVRGTDNSFESFNRISGKDEIKFKSDLNSVLGQVSSEASVAVALSGLAEVPSAEELQLLTESTEGVVTENVISLLTSPLALAVGGLDSEPTATVFTKASAEEVQAAVAEFSALAGQDLGGLIETQSVGDVTKVTVPAFAAPVGGTSPIVNDDRFKSAVGDLEDSLAVAYVDINTLDALSGGSTSALDAFGLNATVSGSNVDVVLRLTVK